MVLWFEIEFSRGPDHLQLDIVAVILADRYFRICRHGNSRLDVLEFIQHRPQLISKILDLLRNLAHASDRLLFRIPLEGSDFLASIFLVMAQLFLLGEQLLAFVIEVDQSVEVDLDVLIEGSLANQFQFGPDVFDVEHRTASGDVLDTRPRIRDSRRARIDPYPSRFNRGRSGSIR